MRNLSRKRLPGISEKSAVERVSKLKEEIESLNNEIQIAQRNYDLNKAAELTIWQTARIAKTVRGSGRKCKEERIFYGS